MSDEEKAVIICQPRISDVDNRVEGCVVDVCVDCGREVWIARSGVRLKQEQNADTICVPCGLKSIEENPETEVRGPNEDQLREIRQHLLSEWL